MTGGADSLAGAVVRVRDPDGRIVGAGFLVAPRLVCTCAHVVARALGGDMRSADPPPGRVGLDFPLLPGPADGSRTTFPAQVAGWRPVLADDTGDLALLRLDEAVPAQVRPPWLVEANELWDHSVRVFGFPSGSDHGVWGTGRLRAAQGAGWVQMQTEAGPRIEPGFSGSPVWDTDLGGVVGMAVAAGLGSGADTAYLHPVSSLLRAWPELAEHALPSCPYRALDAFAESDEAVFCGRDADIDRLETLTARQPVVILSGPSGSGKSSLSRAGLLPRLRRAGHQIADFRPIAGLGPAETLAGALLPLLGNELTEYETAERLTDGRHAEIAARLARRHPHGVLLFADQFEEIATADPATARALLELITGLADPVATPTPVRALLTVRSGSLDRLLTQRNQGSLRDGIAFLAPMDREQLRTAVTGPLAAAPGVVHEPGLVERILDDAGTGPGRLPLVEFALTRLWDRRRGGVLTHEAYDAFGGVAGAVADYAEDVYHRDLRAAEREPARRLFVQLARPEEDGGFARRAVRVEDLDEDQQRLVPRLADRKLLVTTRAVDGAEIADLAHESLIESWDRLREWLAADRDFRDWQERLRADLRQWERLGSRKSALVHGPLLAEALLWSERRPQDVTADEHAYIAAGRARQSREVRRWRIVTAAIAVLALLAAALAGVTYQRTRELSSQLRAQAARLLAQEAQRRADDDPGTAALLALSAWRTDDSQPEAYGALFKLNTRLHNVDLVKRLGVDHVLLFTATPDGSSAVVVDQRGIVSVITGLLGSPEVRQLPGTRAVTAHEPLVKISPDGRKIGMLDDRQGLTVWDVAHPDQPTRLPVPAGWDPAQQTLDVAFSPDSSQLLGLFGHTGSTGTEDDRLGLWNIAGKSLVSRTTLPAGRTFYQAGFGPKPGGVLLYEESTGNGSPQYVRLDPGTGAETGTISALPRGDVGLGGQVVVDCPSEALRIRAAADGTPLRTVPNSGCDGGVVVDGTGRYAFTGPGGSSGTDLATVKVVDLRTGGVAQSAAPVYDVVRGSDFVVLPRKDGRLAILALKGGELLRFTAPRPDRAAPAAMPVSPQFPMFSGDGRFRLLVDDLVGEESVRLRDTTDGRTFTAGAAVRKQILMASQKHSQIAFTSDGRHLVARTGGSLAVYSVPRLSLERMVKLPVPQGMKGDFTGALAAADDGSVLTLYAGTLARWDPATGRALGSPLELRSDDTTLRWLAGQGESVWSRPDHPEQALVRGRDGVMRLWDLGQRRSIGSFQADPDAISAWQSEAFDASGDLLATLSNIKSSGGTRIEFRGVPGFDRVAPPVSAADAYNLVGFTPAGDLISTGSSGTSSDLMQVWSTHVSTEIAGLSMPDGAVWTVHGNVVEGGTTDGSLSVTLDPDAWYAALCSAVDRPFTDAERRLLPEGADSHPACPG
ncbi:S1 family peptidase [Actinacidiphila oryziradicis]|nr:serine protease [Actinacidiphila oryziradicis]